MAFWFETAWIWDLWSYDFLDFTFLRSYEKQTKSHYDYNNTFIKLCNQKEFIYILKHHCLKLNYFIKKNIYNSRLLFSSCATYGHNSSDHFCHSLKNKKLNKNGGKWLGFDSIKNYQYSDSLRVSHPITSGWCSRFSRWSLKNLRINLPLRVADVSYTAFIWFKFYLLII